MKVLITGAGGMTGAELVRQATERSWDVIALGKADLDITDADAVEGIIGHARPDVIINAAAYTAVDAAEQNVEIAMAVNAAEPAKRRRMPIEYGDDAAIARQWREQFLDMA